MRCPRDGSELRTTPQDGNVEADVCPACAGLFLDQGELEAIQAAASGVAGSDDEDSVTEGFEAARNEALGPIDCLRCGKQMERRRFGMGSQVVIDECPGGCGIWLDGGELETLKRLHERGREELHIPLLWRLRAALARSKRG